MAKPEGFSAKKENVLILRHNQEFRFPFEVDCTRFFVDYEYRPGGTIPKLSIGLYIYDDRGRYADRLNPKNMRSDNHCASIVTEMEPAGKSTVTQCVKIDFSKVDPGITSMLMCLDGGPRSFNNIIGTTLRCRSSPGDRGEGTFLSGSGASVFLPLFNSLVRTRKDCLDVAICVIYKDGWDEEGNPMWVAKPVFEPIYQTIVKAKELFCSELVINVVPCLEKCRPRLFSSVRGLCAALSSEALPQMKKKWFRGESDSLNIDEFTEVLFIQLNETHPKIIDELEAGYAVAMIQEMFMQIDYNGDGGSDWNEFTTFLSLTGLGNHGSNEGGGDELNVYKIEYNEDPGRRDRVLPAQKDVWGMRHFPDSKRIVVMPTASDRLMMIDEDFELITTMEATKLCMMEIGEKMQTDSVPNSGQSLIPSAADVAAELKSIVYDVAYLTSKDMYAYSSSDHSISIVREQQGYGERRMIYHLHNRIFHNLLHPRLCWSEAGHVLCSVASDNVIYGWSIDENQSIFQVSRHADLITGTCPAQGGL